MAMIHNLSSKLTLNTKQFGTAMGKAKKRVKRFAGDVGRVGKQLGKFGAAGGVAAVAGLAYLTKQSLASIDATAKLSDRIGISTEKLIGLRHAAELSGAGAAKLDQGLEVLEKRLGEVAATGSGSAAKGLDILGLKAKELTSLSPDQQVYKIADAMSTLDSQSQKAAATAALFSRGNLELVNTLQGGSEALKAAQKEAAKLGLAFSRTDAAKVEAANDAMTRLGELVQGVGQKLAIELAPYIEAVAEQLVDAGTAGKGMGAYVVDGVEWIVKGFAKLADWLELGPVLFYRLQAGATRAVAGVVDGMNGLNHAIAATLNLIPGVNVQLTQTLDLASKNLHEAADKAVKKADLAKQRFSEGANSKAVAGAFDAIRSKSQKAAEAIARNAAAQRKAKEASKEMAAALKQQEENQKKVTDTLADLDKQLAQVGKSKIEIKIDGLKELGATAAQLDAARQKMQRLEGAKGKQDAAKQIADLEKKVRRFGLSDQDKKLLDLDALGASADQLERAQKAMQKLDALKAHKNALQARADAEKQGVGLQQYGSAQAQRLAYQASRGLGASKDDTPARQLKTQTRMAATLEKIADNTAHNDDEWSL